MPTQNTNPGSDQRSGRPDAAAHKLSMKRQRAGEADTSSAELHESTRDQIRALMRAICDTPLYRSSRKLNGERGAALLAKMRTGSQTLSDFEDEHALWGYVNAVGSRRARWPGW